jgi:beta-glucuronidase
MIRHFSPHPARIWSTLDGTWEHRFPAEGAVLAPTDWRSGRRLDLEVPGSWNADTAALRDWRGEAVVRRMFTQPHDGPAVLAFAGVGHTATILIDGREVGRHHDGHTAFAIELPHLARGEHELLVHVDSAFGAQSGLNIANDYFVYGGLVRPVELHSPRRATWIRGVDTQPQGTAGAWRLPCTIHLANAGQTAVETSVRLRCAGADCTLAVHIPPGGTSVQAELALGDAASWNLATPVLHWLEAELADGTGTYDGWRDRIGLRTVAVAGERILLNGEPVFLLGVNRHEDHGAFGCSLTPNAMRLDLELIRDLGCNLVRTCHYPNDRRFLDLCDETGVLVWEENHARGQLIEQMRHPRFREQALASAVEMVEQHANHPSIVLWGVMNECASHDPEGRAMYAEQFAAITARDASRPTTYASCRHNNDICQDLPAVCSWNIYPQWYTSEDPRACVDGLVTRYASKGLADKPLIISEIGAGGIPGLHDPERLSHWSLEGQADIIRRQLEGILPHPRLAGVILWQFCDCRLPLDWGRIARPGGINDKGILDRWRRPKPAYAVVRELFRRRGTSIG